MSSYPALTQEIQLSAELGRDWAIAFVDYVASTYEYGPYQWTQTEYDLAMVDIDSAYRAADEADWWGADAAVFWSNLAALSSEWYWAGSDTMQDTFEAAANTAESAPYTASEAVNDVVDAIEDTGKDTMSLLKVAAIVGAGALVISALRK